MPRSRPACAPPWSPPPTGCATCARSATITAASEPVPDLRLEPLTRADPRFVGFTFPAYQPLLAAGDAATLAIGASVDGIGIGLALARMIGFVDAVNGPAAQLLSLMVTAPSRRRGIGLALLRRLHDALAARGIVGVYSTYSTRLPACLAFERTLAAAAWHRPQFREVRLSGECGKMIAAVAGWPAVERRLSRGARYTFTPWAEVGGDTDHAAIERLCRQPPCARAPLIQPGTWTRQHDPAISIAVRREEMLVGWVAAAPTPRGAADPAPQLYYVSYLDEALQRSGIMVAAYLCAFERQAAAYGADSLALYSAVEPAMTAVTRRRFAPLARWVDEIRISGRRLDSPPATPDNNQPIGPLITPIPITPFPGSTIPPPGCEPPGTGV